MDTEPTDEMLFEDEYSPNYYSDGVSDDSLDDELLFVQLDEEPQLWDSQDVPIPALLPTPDNTDGLVDTAQGADGAGKITSDTQPIRDR